MAVNVTEIYNTTWEHYQKAQESIIAKRSILEHSAAISDVIPGFEADKLEFGSYDKENYAVLFVDSYENLGLYEYAYEYLVHQAKGFEWMLLSVTKDVVTKAGCYRRLKDAIDVRINKGDLLPDDLKEFELIRDWINFTCEIAPVNDN